jgi:hypothetical protein
MINKDKIQQDTTYAVALQNSNNYYPVNMPNRWERTIVFNLFYYHPKCTAIRNKVYNKNYDEYLKARARDIAYHKKHPQPWDEGNSESRAFRQTKPSGIDIIGEMLNWYMSWHSKAPIEGKYAMSGPNQVQFLHTMNTDQKKTYIQHLTNTPQYKKTHKFFVELDANIKKKGITFNSLSQQDQYETVIQNIMLDPEAPKTYKLKDHYGFGNIYDNTYSETVSRLHWHHIDEIFVKMTGAKLLELWDQINWVTTRVICPVELVDEFMSRKDTFYGDKAQKLQQAYEEKLATVHMWLDKHPNRQYYDFKDYVYPYYDTTNNRITELPPFKKFSKQADLAPQLHNLDLFYDNTTVSNIMREHRAIDQELMKAFAILQELNNTKANNTKGETVIAKQNILSDAWQSTLNNWEMKMFSVGQQL